MPTSEQNLEGFKQLVQQMTADGLVDFARNLDSDFEIPGIDFWVEQKHKIPGRAAIQAEVTTLSLAGLKRFREHFSERLQVIEDELKKRETRKGPPPKGKDAPMWMVAIIYDELINKKRRYDAEQLRARYKVSAKTLKRYRDDPHLDER